MSTAKFHFSPVTQKYARCNAHDRPCRYGTASDISEKEFYASKQPEQKSVVKKPVAAVVKKTSSTPASPSPTSIPMVNIDGASIDARIAADKNRPLFCAHCRTTFTKDEHTEMLSSSPVEDYPCGSCGRKNTWNDCGIDVVEPDAKLLTDQGVKENLWFHVTSRQNWIEDINSAGSENISDLPMIHVGSKEAALDRLSFLSANNKNEKWYLYAVKVNPAAPIAKTVFGDQDDFPTTYGRAQDEIGKKDYAVTGVTRYVNRYEGPGTISLMANPSAIKVVETRELEL